MYPIKSFYMKGDSLKKELVTYPIRYCDGFKLNNPERYYFYKLFPKLEKCTENELDIAMEYADKIFRLSDYGFDTITLITKEENRWYFSDRKQFIDGRTKNIRTFTDAFKENLRYGKCEIGTDYLDESVSSMGINPSYKFIVNYYLDSDESIVEIVNKEIMVRDLDFDLSLLPSKEELENPNWEYEIEKQKVKKIR